MGPLWQWAAGPGPRGSGLVPTAFPALLTVWVTFLLGAAFRDNLQAFLARPDTSPLSVPGIASSKLNTAFAFSCLRNWGTSSSVRW